MATAVKQLFQKVFAHVPTAAEKQQHDEVLHHGEDRVIRWCARVGRRSGRPPSAEPEPTAKECMDGRQSMQVTECDAQCEAKGGGWRSNRGTGASIEERHAQHLVGLVPPVIETLDHQAARCLARLRSLNATPLEQYCYLDRIRTENTNLFYHLVMNNLKETVKVIYTPTVGTACLEFSHIYTTGAAPGLFLSLSHKDILDEVISNWPGPDPEIIVMTDGSRILGLGDLGVNGMGIPIGKLSLYVAAGGFMPSRTLPICLDVGTNNAKNIADPFYVGSKEARPDDKTFHEFVDAVMVALKKKWPSCLVQFEDFSSEHAFETLNRLRNKYCMFNDDIQGTGAVILSGFINALKLSGVPLKDHRIMFVGAGSAGVGVASQLMDHFVRAGGLSKAEAKNLFWLLDSKGVITSDRADVAKYPAHKLLFMREDMGGKQISSLEEAIDELKPTALIGLSAVGGTFTPSILTKMGQNNAKPIVFPLSNPLTAAECSFEDAVKYTNGTVLFASGTAFPSQEHPVTKQLLEPGQGNNMYVFPALGFGSVLAKAVHVTDNMIYDCSVNLANSLNEEEISKGFLYPRIERIREISARLSRDVIISALKEGLARESFVLNLYEVLAGEVISAELAQDELKAEDLLKWVKSKMYEPHY
ncbi:hypothetical protein BC830DRAFT_1167303 [Chytriomyces sp. MP71]|nr:hypothetical protein BC830DRAFT_1167303 [Chytriomyces sp. MP71]